MKKSDIINFGAGPAALPESVLSEAAAAVLNYRDTGLSILEIPHRGPLFAELLAESKSLVLQLAGLSAEEYEVLWLQGGGRMQFAMIPMNFLAAGATAGYIDSGYWAYDAMEHARLFGNVDILASSREIGYTVFPELHRPIPDTLSYVHLTTNNTIYGTQLQDIPDCPVPLFADMSSDIFSQKREYRKFDLFYAVAQKNLGAAGNTLVVLRKNLLDKVVRRSASILDYSMQVKSGSVLNTPPVFAIYISLLTLRWIKAKGIDTIEQETLAKAQLLYGEVERNTLLEPVADTADRSRMNVVFRMKDTALEKELSAHCLANGIEGIEGHRSVGGFRVSLYNAISLAQVQKLVDTLQEFEKKKTKK
ncbi:MAG TPA: 3-phosphoserine/phosphohydroxythreonine transaminase [Chitinophagaceae bacterium]|nr:3-phosphoserine/phosphohydroxythreonine transaminase [Chitinophagaceae bacterium]